jgi:uncharacterized protein YlxW (UPF0749 family)
VQRPWRLAVPAVAVLAGLLFAATARAAGGTDLRGGDRSDLPSLVRAEQERVAAAAISVQELQVDLDRLTGEVARRDTRVAMAKQLAAARAGAAGFEALRGPGLTVTLDDAPRTLDGDVPPAEASNDDLVVHQQDVQAVVNALWAGGADAVQLMDQRVISTSAVRCVGTTLVLQGRIYPPPYTVTAIGDPDRLRAAIDGSYAVARYLAYVDRFGLVFDITDHASVEIPGYDGSLDLQHARVPNAETGARADGSRAARIRR